VVLTVALEANVPQHDHFVVAFDLFEGLFQNLNGVLTVAGEEFFKRAGHASRGLDQTVTSGIFASPLDNRSHRRFDFGPAGLLDTGWCRFGTTQRE
jgi:hypothetical protein